MPFKQKMKNIFTHPYAAPLYRMVTETGYFWGEFPENVGRYSVMPLLVLGAGIATGVAALSFMGGGSVLGQILVTGITSVLGAVSSIAVIPYALTAIATPFKATIEFCRGVKDAMKYRNDVTGYRQMINPPPPVSRPQAVTTSAPPPVVKTEVERLLDKTLDEMEGLDTKEKQEFIQGLQESYADVFNAAIKKHVDAQVAMKTAHITEKSIPRKKASFKGGN